MIEALTGIYEDIFDLSMKFNLMAKFIHYNRMNINDNLQVTRSIHLE